MLLASEELRQAGITEDAIEIYRRSNSQLQCCQWVLAALHHLNVIDSETYEHRLKEIEMPGIKVQIVVTDENGEEYVSNVFQQSFKDKKDLRRFQPLYVNGVADGLKGAGANHMFLHDPETFKQVISDMAALAERDGGS